MRLAKTRAAAAALAGLPAVAARAQEAGLPALETVGRPVDGAMGLQPAATGLAADFHFLDNFVLVIITVIVALVVTLLAIVILRYNRRANPVPARFSHNAPLEVTWTVVPILILVVIGSFSLPVLFRQQEIPRADITIKVTGMQWFWNYEYVDHGFEFASFLLPREDLEAHGYAPTDYLLAADAAVVVPVGKTIVMQLTAADVIHAWAVPAFGVKQDAVPGRLAQLWFAADREGVYFGQCSELCGKDHSYMPITVKVVSEAAYEAWLEQAVAAYGGRPRDTRLARAD